MDLAQSFLNTQPSSERRQLEDALTAESQDLGASVAASEDSSSSDDDLGTGTGQALSVPAFLAGYLQGILDRVQVRIRNVRFELDIDVPIEPTSAQTEPVTIQIALDSVDVEGVTTRTEEDDSTRQAREGMRHISLNDVRASLISEANIFSSLTRSTSVTSPSLASSPAMTRSPPSRETSNLSRGQFQGESMQSLQESLQDSHSDNERSQDDNYPLADSEEALEIPYDLPAEEEDGYESPATPRASIYHESNPPIDESVFHSLYLPSNSSPHGRRPQDEPTEDKYGALSEALPSQPESQVRSSTPPANLRQSRQLPTLSKTSSNISAEGSSEDLTQSHLFTHEDAESMYMSAFSDASAQSSRHYFKDAAPEPEPTRPPAPLPQPQPQPVEALQEEARPRTPRQVMPGGWDEAGESEPESFGAASAPLKEHPPADDASEGSSPAFSRASLTEHPITEPARSRNGSEDAATPKGPTRLVKEIMSVKTISLFIPTTPEPLDPYAASSESIAALSQSMGRSVYPHAPGAFSVHGAGAPRRADHRTTTPSQKDAEDPFEVDISPIKVNFDTSIGFMLAVVIGKLLAAVPTPTSKPTTKDTHERPQSQPLNVKLRLEQLSVNFLNRLSGVAETAERYLDPTAFNFDDEVLLNVTTENLTCSTSSVPDSSNKGSASSTITKVDVGKFRFGYATGVMLSFDQLDDLRSMSSSVRDTLISPGNDIAIKLTQSAGKMTADIETMPIDIMLNLQRIDETFSWFGGLSSFLNMSASITSSTSLVPKPAPVPVQRPRGVRFETPIDPTDKSAASANKFNVRIGGLLLVLVGKDDCRVNVVTKTWKVVGRKEGLGISCNSLRLLGPYMINTRLDHAVNIEAGDLLMEFRNTPRDADLEKLLELITPSKVKFDQEGDEIMVDTLLRQRRKGSVLSVSLGTLSVKLKNLERLFVLPGLVEELAKLSTVAKYLPEDDRPGLLTLGKIGKISAGVHCGPPLGHFVGELLDLNFGHITIPSLIAAAVYGVSVVRNGTEELVSSSAFPPRGISHKGPVLIARMIGDEIEPVVKLRLQDLCVEYRVPTIMDLLGLGKDATPQDFENSLAASVANLGDQAHGALAGQPSSPTQQGKGGNPMTLDVGFRDCLVGLNPLGLPSKLIVALTESHLEIVLPKDVQTKAVLTIGKASVLLIDDASEVTSQATPPDSRRRPSSSASQQVAEICAQGFVDICYMSSAKVVVDIAPGVDGEKQVTVQVRDDLLILETCADSTQTLITLANALKPPTPPSKESKYRTNVVPMEDMLASISAEAFGKPEGEYDFDQDFAGAQELAGYGSEFGYGSDHSLRIESQFYGDESFGEEMFDAMKSSAMSHDTTMQDTHEGVLLTSSRPAPTDASSDSEELIIHDNFYQAGSEPLQPAKVWNSVKNTYDQAPSAMVKRCPLKLSVKDVHFIWNLFDGYDWEQTRDVITKAVREVENKATERLKNQHVYEEEIEDEEAIGDFLFNSIYIGIPANRDPHELSRAINEGLHDNATETESVATTAFTGTTNRTARPHLPRAKRLRLNRSKHHKITFELQGLNVDMFVFPEDAGETTSSVDIRIKNVDVYDHVPTSTWKTFATYDQDSGEREMGTSMAHLELLSVKPQPELGATDTVLRVTVLPLRLHVDQDALDFITRFFEFKNEKVPVHSSPSDVPFIQRAEINAISVKLDFKPKRVDYAGLRSGHTTEFMNFIVLQESRMVLRRAIIYGVSGFDRLGIALNDVWMPDVRTNQLPGVVAGLAPVRSLVNIGSGFKDLVEIPLREYQKDGRVIRSISKGAAAFARTTGTELVKLGAKLAVGTQYALQSAEGMLTDNQPRGNWEDDDMDPEDRKQISLYAEQPSGVMQGLRGGYHSLARDINLARDAIIAVPGEVMESASAGGAAKAVLRRAPTVIFRPAMGVSKAVGQTLMGATNSIDPQNRRRVEEVSALSNPGVYANRGSRNTSATKAQLPYSTLRHLLLAVPDETDGQHLEGFERPRTVAL